MIDRRTFLKAGAGIAAFLAVGSRKHEANAQFIYYPEVKFIFPETFFEEYDPKKTGKVTWDQYWGIERNRLEKELENVPSKDAFISAALKRAREAFKEYDTIPDGIITMEDYKK